MFINQRQGMWEPGMSGFFGSALNVIANPVTQGKALIKVAKAIAPVATAPLKFSAAATTKIASAFAPSFLKGTINTLGKVAGAPADLPSLFDSTKKGTPATALPAASFGNWLTAPLANKPLASVYGKPVAPSAAAPFVGTPVQQAAAALVQTPTPALQTQQSALTSGGGGGGGDSGGSITPDTSTTDATLPPPPTGWAALSGGQQIMIVGGGLAAAGLAYYMLKKKH